MRTCTGCEHWIMGIPCGHCGHPQGYYHPTFDIMVFEDAGEDCPLNRLRCDMIKNPTLFEEKLKKRVQDLGIKGAVIGISGGKDSTIVAKLMSDILGKENVIGVLMPNGKQSDIDVSNEVVKMLGINSVVVNIGNSMNGLDMQIFNALRSISKDLTEDAFINMPPRIRMTTLYAIAQSMGHGWRVIGTTNKSEEYIGWLTKWGDGAADFEPILDFTVTELRELGVNLGIPKHLVYKVPIDGLADGTDEDRFGFTYDMLDKYIETGTCGDKKVDEKIDKMHRGSEHKRNPVPTIKFC